MSKDTNLYLSDKQYLTLLGRARKHLDTVKKIKGYDDTTVGNKSTETNVGLCNDELTTKRTAMWPGQFPQRKSMKYRQNHHKCPLDRRTLMKLYKDGTNGCFWTCLFFQKKPENLNLQMIKELFDQLIVEVKAIKEGKGGFKYELD